MLHRLRHVPAGIVTALYVAAVLSVAVGAVYGSYAALITGAASLVVAQLVANALRSAGATSRGGRFMNSLLHAIGRYPVHTATLVLVVLVVMAVARGAAFQAAAEEAAAQVQELDGQKNSARTERASRDAELSKAKQRVSDIEKELASFENVIAPERERRRIAAEEEQKKKEADKLARETEAEAQRKAEEAKAAAARRATVVTDLKVATTAVRKIVKDSADSFEEVAFDPNPSLTWIPGIWQGVNVMRLCEGVEPSELGGACNTAEVYQAVENLRQTYADFFVGRVPVGWVAEKQQRAYDAIDEWTAKVNKLR